MKLVRVTGREFATTCHKCHKRVWHDPRSPHPIYADLDGRPFIDYFCEKCAEVKAQQENHCV